jgi:signal transduction histidine kinase
VAVFHNITDRKAAEARLAATVAELREREPDLNAFAAVVAHDLNSALHAVGGYAELLDDSLIRAPSRPVVDADPVLLRQLLDNLIGNALKYTLPGQPARIDIAAATRTRRGGRGWRPPIGAPVSHRGPPAGV